MCGWCGCGGTREVPEDQREEVEDYHREPSIEEYREATDAEDQYDEETYEEDE
jgi:hypothetical protein